nr:MAG TPA: hypothetical protein [Bacteriophage sp.]
MFLMEMNRWGCFLYPHCLNKLTKMKGQGHGKSNY